MITPKEAAGLRREQADLLQQKVALQKEFKPLMATATAEQVAAEQDKIQKINDRIDAITEQLAGEQSAPQPEGGFSLINQTQPTQGITKDNFRESGEYRDAFYRSLSLGRVSESDANVLKYGKQAITSVDGEGVASGGNYLVPTTTLNKIHDVIQKYGRVYAAISKYTFDGDVSLPIGTAKIPTTNSDGVDELTFEFTEATLSNMAVVATIIVKNLMLKKGIPALESYLATEIGKYLGITLENYVLTNAVNHTNYQGIVPHLKASPDPRVGTYKDFTWATVGEIMGDVNSPYGDNATWIMARKTFFNKVFAMTDAAGRPVVTTAPSAVSGGTPPRDNFDGAVSYLIAGQPVIFTDFLPAADEGAILYFDLNQYVANESLGITIESNTSEKFSSDKTVWRGKLYGAGKPMFAKSAGTYYTYDPS